MSISFINLKNTGTSTRDLSMVTHHKACSLSGLFYAQRCRSLPVLTMTRPPCAVSARGESKTTNPAIVHGVSSNVSYWRIKGVTAGETAIFLSSFTSGERNIKQRCLW